MATFFVERGRSYRIQWKFKIRVGPRAGETVKGGLQLGRCTKAAAKAQLRQIDEWEEAVRTGRYLPNESFNLVRDRWLRERELACTPQTLERTKRVFDLYLRWRTDRGLQCGTLSEIANREELSAWRDHRLDKEAGRKTVANDLSTLAAFFDWCVLEKYLQDNPIRRITRPRFTPRREGTPLTRTQAGGWLWSIRPRNVSSGSGPWSWDEVRRKRRLIVFLLNTGLRNGELCSLNIEDLRIDGHEQLVYVVGKGLKERWVPLNLAALASLHLTLRDRGNPKIGPLFTTKTGERYNVRQLAGEIVKSANGFSEPIGCNPHNLRHSFATWMARSTSNVAMVQKVLGHENVNTTLKYYVHTSDHELARATSNLRGRKHDRIKSPIKKEVNFRVIPFPNRHVS